MMRSTEFFEQQRLQKQRTVVLVTLFILMVAALSLFTGGTLSWLYFVKLHRISHFSVLSPLSLRISMIVATGIGLISMIRISMLQDGGDSVARMLGATRVTPKDEDPLRHQLIHVVEEMSIAAGIAVPKCYVLESEAHVNAMAAGYEPGQAVVIVTQGTLEMLSRDELQGVIAHEFSHILNGDMRLNIQITGAVAGLVSIAELGRILMNFDRDSRGQNRGLFFSLGLLLLMVGGLGVLLSRILQASISRGREVLADASACQFTRNPAGLAAALAKVRFFLSSSIRAPRVEQTAHFFFAQAVPSSPFFSLFDTHPPLEERIAQLDRQFLNPIRIQDLKKSLDQLHPTLDTLKEKTTAAQSGPTESVVTTALRELDKIPKEIRVSLREPAGAKEAILGVIRTGETSPVAAYASPLSPDRRLNLIFLALPVLHDLPLIEKRRFIEAVEKSLHGKNGDPIFEFACLMMVKYALLPGRPPLLNIVNLRPILTDLEKLYSWLIRAGHMSSSDQTAALQAAMKNLSLATVPTSLTNAPLTEIEEILSRLRGLPPAWKERVINGMWTCLLFDRRIEVEEAEAARAICAVLSVPIPPIVGQSPKDLAKGLSLPDINAVSEKSADNIAKRRI